MFTSAIHQSSPRAEFPLFRRPKGEYPIAAHEGQGGQQFNWSSMKRVLLLLLSLCLAVQAETLKVSFRPSDEPTEALKGNLILVLSQREFAPWSPGLLTTYLGGLKVVTDVSLSPGDSLAVEVPDGFDYIGAYLDGNQNFMLSGQPEPGEYYCSEFASAGELVLNKQRSRRSAQGQPWLQERIWLSPRMLEAGFSREQSTVRYLVGLPPGYWTSGQTYPTVYITHGFSGNRWSYINRFKAWRKQMEREPMVLVSLDSEGPYGHHLFLNSPGNGPMTDVLVEEIIPYLDETFRTNGRRVVYGQSSGGWTAISLMRRAPGVFCGAAATGPDPLDLSAWWMDSAQNMYHNTDGSSRMFSPVFGLTMKRAVECELETRSPGQYAAFMAAFSPYDATREPFPFVSPFDLTTGELDPAVWKVWEENDQTLWARANPAQAKRAWEDKLALFVGDQDEFGLLETSRIFHSCLNDLDIDHLYREIPGAGHTNYLERPEFVKELWTTLYRMATR